MLEKDLEFYEHTEEAKPKHGASGTWRQFMGEWTYTDGKLPTYSSDRMGNDIYCSKCNHWSTVKGTNILYSVMGDCKNCGTTFLKK